MLDTIATDESITPIMTEEQVEGNHTDQDLDHEVGIGTEVEVEVEMIETGIAIEIRAEVIQGMFEDLSDMIQEDLAR